MGNMFSMLAEVADKEPTLAWLWTVAAILALVSFALIRPDSTFFCFRTIIPSSDRWLADNKWCSGRDLNPHAFRHTPLKRTCLPFHHPSLRKWIVNVKWRSEARKRFVVQVFTLAHARNRK